MDTLTILRISSFGALTAATTRKILKKTNTIKYAYFNSLTYFIFYRIETREPFYKNKSSDNDKFNATYFAKFIYMNIFDIILFSNLVNFLRTIMIMKMRLRTLFLSYNKIQCKIWILDLRIHYPCRS